VLEDFKRFDYEWMLWHDGTRSQQRGSEHQYTIYKFVDPESDEGKQKLSERY